MIREMLDGPFPAGELAVRLMGIRVVESPLLPIPSGHKADARRAVRHGYAERRLAGMDVDVMTWLGLDVGPPPGAPVELLVVGDTAHCSAAIIGRLRAGAADGPFSIAPTPKD